MFARIIVKIDTVKIKVKNIFFLKYLFLFIIINLGLYLFITQCNSWLPLEQSFHSQRKLDFFLQDSRIVSQRFDLINNLAQYDAQWYLKIASQAYKNNQLSFAFFPLYPLLLGSVNYFLKNIVLTAFLLSNLLLIGNFTVFYFLMSKFFRKTVVIKAAFLLFLFPFSIFFRSYFAESLFLLLLIVFTYFLLSKRYFWPAFILGLMNVTKANVFLLNIYFLINYYQYFKQKKIAWKNIFFIILLLVLPTIGWLIYCHLTTGDVFVFLKVRSNWFYDAKPPFFIFYNLKKIIDFPFLPWHFYYNSKIEVLTILAIFFLLFKNKKAVRPELWWISFCLYLLPLLTTTTMSFIRYQIVSFPLFLILAKKLKGWRYFLLLGIFAVGLLTASLFFINWYWLG